MVVEVWHLSPSSHPSWAGETAGWGSEGRSPFTPGLAKLLAGPGSLLIAPGWRRWLGLAATKPAPGQPPHITGRSDSRFWRVRGSSSRALSRLFIKHLQSQLLGRPPASHLLHWKTFPGLNTSSEQWDSCPSRSGEGQSLVIVITITKMVIRAEC